MHPSIGLDTGKPALVYLASVYSMFAVCQFFSWHLAPAVNVFALSASGIRKMLLVPILSHQRIECKIARPGHLTWMLISAF